jgi:DNA-binding transcriptional ArsR family regulator
MTRTASPVDAFAAIAEPRRRAVIAVLSDGEEYAVNDIILRVRLAQPAVSKHLGALRTAGIVTVVKRGQHRMYRLSPEGLRPVHEWMKTFDRYWTHQIDQVKQRAERKALERMIRVDDDGKRAKED